MNIKRGLFVIILTFSIILISNLSLGSLCDTSSTTSSCGTLITQTGHGAVQLCNDCFVCGVQDGVCPAWYSTGETKNGTEVLVRKGTQDRLNETSDEYKILYNSSEEACEYIGGTLAGTETKEKLTDEWGTTDPETNNYVQAICDEVPKTPSCDHCIDLDCTTEVRGTAFLTLFTGGKETQIPTEARITIHPQIEQLREEIDYIREGQANETGEFIINNAYSGNVIVRCAADGLTPTEKQVTLKPGKNIIDCRMGHATCDAQCTLPSSQFGQRVCSAECEGQEGCDFSENLDDNNPMGLSAEDIRRACDGRPEGFFYQLNTTTKHAEGIINVTGIRCCNEYPVYRTYPIFNIEDSTESDVSSLLTRRYSKVLGDGTPVFLNIIVYNK